MTKVNCYGDRLKRAGSGNYFDELLARIRDIRSAEKVFLRIMLNIYTTSIAHLETAFIGALLKIS